MFPSTDQIVTFFIDCLGYSDDELIGLNTKELLNLLTPSELEELNQFCNY